MTIDQFLPSGPKPAAINTGQFDLDVHVAANVAEFEIVGAPEPIGPLQIGQGKWFVTGRRCRYYGRRGLRGFGSDPLPRPPVLVEDFAHAPLPPPEKPIIVPCRQGCRILPCFPADRSAPEKHACVGVPRAYRRCSRNLRKLDGRFLSSNHGSSARTVAYVIRCPGLERFIRLACTHKISS